MMFHSLFNKNEDPHLKKTVEFKQSCDCENEDEKIPSPFHKISNDLYYTWNYRGKIIRIVNTSTKQEKEIALENECRGVYPISDSRLVVITEEEAEAPPGTEAWRRTHDQNDKYFHSERHYTYNIIVNLYQLKNLDDTQYVTWPKMLGYSLTFEMSPDGNRLLLHELYPHVFTPSHMHFAGHRSYIINFSNLLCTSLQPYINRINPTTTVEIEFNHAGQLIIRRDQNFSGATLWEFTSEKDDTLKHVATLSFTDVAGNESHVNQIIKFQNGLYAICYETHSHKSLLSFGVIKNGVFEPFYVEKDYDFRSGLPILKGKYLLYSLNSKSLILFNSHTFRRIPLMKVPKYGQYWGPKIYFCDRDNLHVKDQIISIAQNPYFDKLADNLKKMSLDVIRIIADYLRDDSHPGLSEDKNINADVFRTANHLYCKLLFKNTDASRKQAAALKFFIETKDFELTREKFPDATDSGLFDFARSGRAVNRFIKNEGNKIVVRPRL